MDIHAQMDPHAHTNGHITHRWTHLHTLVIALSPCTHACEHAGVMDLADRAGPLSTLRSWHQAHCRVRVDTRHASGRRGTAEVCLLSWLGAQTQLFCLVPQTTIVQVVVHWSLEQAGQTTIVQVVVHWSLEQAAALMCPNVCGAWPCLPIQQGWFAAPWKTFALYH